MIKVENIEGHGFEAAVRGMRNPLNSWEKSDSRFRLRWIERHDCYEGCNILGDRVEATINEAYCTDCIIGPDDLDLMKRLYKAGPEHRKFLRMIVVTMDITAPLYWWKEFDTYKVGTVANSCSTMHKIAEKEFTLDDFSHEHLTFFSRNVINATIKEMNIYRKWYIDYDSYNDDDRMELDSIGVHSKKECWWQLIQLLPSSYNQRRTVQMSYENVVTIMKQRKGHKLDEWNELIEIFKEFPGIKEITE